MPSSTTIRSSDTIAAISTAPGRGGIGVVRVSGPATRAMALALLGRRAGAAAGRAARLCRGRRQRHRHRPRAVLPGAAFVHRRGRARAARSRRPRGHGPAAAARAGAGRPAAHAGEFTQRAYLNDKLDLAQAEAIADLIDSGSAQAARAALRSLQGEFSAQVHELAERMLELRLWIEAAIDFPEEEIDFLADRALGERMQHLRQRFAALAETARQGTLLRDGLTVVIAGRPNAGKSSLLNRLAGYDAAIVTPTPGTTRDVLRERIAIDGLPLHVLDTAGLRDARDEVEAEGIRRARHEIARADRVLFVVDAADPQAVAAIEHDLQHVPAKIPLTLVFNKVDRSGDAGPRRDRPRHGTPGLPQRGHRRGHRPAARAPQGLHRLRTGRRGRALGPHAPPRRAAARRPARRRGAAGCCANATPASWSRRSCARRTRPSARSPARCRATTCWGGSSRASASASNGDAASIGSPATALAAVPRRSVAALPPAPGRGRRRCRPPSSPPARRARDPRPAAARSVTGNWPISGTSASMPDFGRRMKKNAPPVMPRWLPPVD